MDIPKSYEALAADLASEKIISKTLQGQKESYMMLADGRKFDLDAIQQRLTVAEQRAEHWRGVSSEATCRAAALNDWVGELEKALADVPRIYFEGCDFQGLNADGSEPLEFTDDPIKKIKSIRLIGWRCEGPRMAEEGITVKDKLAIAEKELADLHAEIKAAGKPPHGDYWHQSLYEDEKKVDDAKAALKPAAEGEGS